MLGILIGTLYGTIFFCAWAYFTGNLTWFKAMMGVIIAILSASLGSLLSYYIILAISPLIK